MHVLKRPVAKVFPPRDPSLVPHAVLVVVGQWTLR